MKVSTENDNNFGYEKITILVDNMPLRGHLGTKKNWPYKTGDLLKEFQFIQHFLWQDKKKVTF
jgi:hypothetical protein